MAACDIVISLTSSIRGFGGGFSSIAASGKEQGAEAGLVHVAKVQAGNKRSKVLQKVLGLFAFGGGEADATRLDDRDGVFANKNTGR